VSSSSSSGPVWFVPIEFPRMCISVNPRNCTYAFPRRCISTFQEYFTLAFNSTSIGGLWRIKISLLIRSPLSAPPLFMYHSLHHDRVKVLNYSIHTNTILLILTWFSPYWLVNRWKGFKVCRCRRRPVRSGLYLLSSRVCVFV